MRLNRLDLAGLLGGAMRPGADIGPADTQLEGSYRRGYQQAIAEVAAQMRADQDVTPELLDAWVEGVRMQWRHVSPLHRKILAPALIET
ncbi:hypothetical protein AVHY2522_24525 [Acidovorax sp. SUPP2522]|uniref:hypothetical protein n=1 Tax=unclassified Acidovorax TaxID=2684926 RepID=UPI00234A08E9|nr:MULTISPECIES: hypothetical protein [unclassified Acidovorax]WCM95738.1 hypothetical protein M5C96_14745 [Acidovorax sp. GBBC 1281]WCN00209.1 hypothetical protein M5C96_12865 [Acidovorax sp. GBBC 1281]GKT20006.1 hypothetical protein AVHY2522_24525 [Acidovorax sp. SUPP2522]